MKGSKGTRKPHTRPPLLFSTSKFSMEKPRHGRNPQKKNRTEEIDHQLCGMRQRRRCTHSRRRPLPLSLCPSATHPNKHIRTPTRILNCSREQRPQSSARVQRRSAATSRYGSFAPRLSRPSRQLVTRVAPPLRRALVLWHW